MLQSNVTAAKVLEEQEFGVILISPSFQLSLSFLENQEFKSVCILALVNYCAEHCTVLNDPYKHATSPILFCTINSVFSAIISGKLFLSVNITSESCLHEKSPVVFKILVLSRALLGAGPGRAVAPHHGDRDTHTHQPPPSMAIMLQNKHHAISIHFCPSFNQLSHIFSDLCLLYS